MVATDTTRPWRIPNCDASSRNGDRATKTIVRTGTARARSGPAETTCKLGWDGLTRELNAARSAPRCLGLQTATWQISGGSGEVDHRRCDPKRSDPHKPSKNRHSGKDGRCVTGVPIVTLPRLSNHPRVGPHLAFRLPFGGHPRHVVILVPKQRFQRCNWRNDGQVDGPRQRNNSRGSPKIP